MKIITWDKDKAKQELAKRLKESSEYRSKYEYFWEKNEALMFEAEGRLNQVQGNVSPELGTYVDNSGLDSAGVPQNSAYAFKNLRFIHSQMSANPPSVITEPTSSDPDDRIKAMAADRLVHHGRRKYKLAEKIDLLSLHTLVYGSGFIKTVFDSGKGEIVDVDEDGNIVLEGDISITVPSVWDMYVDFHAESPDDIQYMIHRIYMPLDTAKAKWPEYEEELEKATDQSSGDSYTGSKANRSDMVEVYEYWEKGLPENAFDGRYALFLKDGTVLGKVEPNPHRFLSAETVRKIKEKYGSLGEDVVEAKINAVPQKAELPFHMLTDIDVPQCIYGKSGLDYVGHIQDNMNRIILTVLDNIAAHGAAQIVLPEGSEIADDSIVNVPFNVIKISGQAPPFPMNPPQLLSDMTPMIDRLKNTIDDLMGVNDAMFGQMKRETSGTSMQYATNQGNMIRRRLFNKYTDVVESVYSAYLKLVRKHFDMGRLDHIIGQEHPLETLSIKNIDIDGGYDIKVSYGTSLSLDPVTRREEINAYMPLFEKIGVPTDTIADMAQLTELRGLYDENRVAKERQREIFDEMIETDLYIRPEENQDHVKMLAYALRYVMSREFFDLEEDKKALINQHIADRKQLAANEIQTGGAQPAPMAPQPAAPVDMGGMPVPPMNT